jgi:hypothetical protein
MLRLPNTIDDTNTDDIDNAELITINKSTFMIKNVII